MGQHILPGNPPVTLTLRASARARRISLRVSQVDGRVTLTYPRHVPAKEALEFGRRKAGWLRAKLDQQPPDVPVTYGADLPVNGEKLRIAPGDGRRLVAGDGVLMVPGPPDRVGPRVAGFLKSLARDRLTAACDRYAAQLGQPYTRISLKDTRTRWGSCTSAGGLMFSWRLILAPGDVLDYVAAHEVAHLREMNHSPAYWAVVETLLPTYAAPRRWLKDNGVALHRYRFG